VRAALTLEKTRLKSSSVMVMPMENMRTDSPAVKEEVVMKSNVVGRHSAVPAESTVHTGKRLENSVLTSMNFSFHCGIATSPAAAAHGFTARRPAVRICDPTVAIETSAPGTGTPQ
jgi:hypothetical protein